MSTEPNTVESGPQPRLRGIAGAVLAAVFYTAGMAIVWLVAGTGDRSGYPPSRDFILPLAVLVALAVVLAFWSRLRPQRSWRVGIYGIAGLLIVSLPLIDGIQAMPWQALGWSGLIVIGLNTALVGIGEETIFRGLIINALLPRLTVAGAVAVSAVLFGLLHSVNVLIISPPTAVLVQVVLTGIVGLALGWIYVLTRGNLVLVIVIHWLYDFGLVSAIEAGSESLWGSVAPVVVVVVAIVLTVIGVRARRGSRQLFG